MPTDEQPKVATLSLWRLKLMTFISGAALMSLEMAGVRILNVYFGSTIYVWGAIIGIFLGALSLGYYLGGIVADKKPQFSMMGILLVVISFFIFLVPFVSAPLCIYISNIDGMDPRIQALVSSFTLYFIPSVLLGMISPFAVRLAAIEVKDIGKVAGRLYAISTLGSIVGTFLTAFILVEFMGMRSIIWSIGILLILTSLLSFTKPKSIITTLLIGFVMTYSSFINISKHMVDMKYMSKIMEEFDSPYHHISITRGPDLIDRSQDANFLMFNTQIQSGLIVNDKNKKVESACGYIKMLHLGRIFDKQPPQKALVIGCGGGIGPMIFRQDYPSLTRIDVVDIDKRVFEMAEKYFGYPKDDNIIKSHITDGRRFLNKTQKEFYDYIILDAYSSGGRVPFHLLTKEFFQIAESKISKTGCLVINLISATEGKDARLLGSVVKTLQVAFKKENGGNIYIFPRNGYNERAMNIIIVCTKSGKRLTQRNVANLLREKLKNNLIKNRNLYSLVYNMMPEYTVPKDTILITDDYAPLDSMVCR